MFKRILDNDTFVAKNADQIVKKYGRKTIVICQGEIFTGTKAMERARRKFPGVVPMLFSVPPNLLGQKDIFDSFKIIFDTLGKRVIFTPY